MFLRAMVLAALQVVAAALLLSLAAPCTLALAQDSPSPSGALAQDSPPQLRAQQTGTPPLPLQPGWRIREPGPDASVRDRHAYWSIVPLPEPTPPPGLERRRPLSAPQRLQKRVQRPFSVIGVPQVGGNPDVGVLLGGVMAATWYGHHRDPFYDYTPFDRQLLLQAQVGLSRQPNVLSRQHHILRYTEPYLAESLVSLRVEADYLMNANAPYFGATARSMGSLSEVGPDALSDRTFDTFRAYEAALRAVRDDDTTYAVYHRFLSHRPRLTTTASLDLLGGILVPSVSFELAHVFLDRYGGESVRSGDTQAVSRPTKLDEDCEAGLARRCQGGWDNTIKLALTLDVRDFALDPDRGALLDVSFEVAPTFLGSPGYWRWTHTAQVYVSPLQEWLDLHSPWAQLVFAARVSYSVAGGNVPFYAAGQLAFHNRNVPALGGLYSLRGYRLNRFVGNVMALVNLELRYDLFFARTRRSTLNLKLVPFFDTGRAWDEVRDTSLKGYRYDGGVGLYLQWNQSHIIRGDVGVGDEGVSGGVSYGLLF